MEPSEIERRREALRQSWASIELEGGVIPDEIKSLQERYARGEITADDLLAGTDAHLKQER